MDLTSLITEFGAYYIQGGQNEQRLVQQLYERSETEMAFSTRLTDETVYRASESTIDRLLQPFQKGWTPIGTLGFTPVSIEQFPLKMDFEDYPHELEATWLGFMSDQQLTPKDWPFVRWLVENHLLPKMRQDFELNEIYQGVQAAPPTPGTAGAVSTGIDGIKKIINDWITATRITTIATGALSTDPETFVDQIEAFVDAINTRYWGIPMELNMGQTLERRFLRGYERKYGKNTDYRGGKTSVDFTNVTIKGRPSHNSTEKIWCTPKENAIILKKKSVNENRVQIEGEDRKVKIWTDYYKGIGFLIPEIVFTNDRDLV